MGLIFVRRRRPVRHIGRSNGTAAHHVDVTNRLRELARQDRIFGMGNSMFGIDPDLGHIKVLRIFARTPNGQERFFRISGRRRCRRCPVPRLGRREFGKRGIGTVPGRELTTNPRWRPPCNISAILTKLIRFHGTNSAHVRQQKSAFAALTCDLVG